MPPPPTAVRRWQKSRRIYVRPQTGPQSAHLWWPAVAKLQATSVPVAHRQLRNGTYRRTDGQTDGSPYTKMPPRAGVTISGAKRLCIRDRSLLPQVCAQPRTSAVKVTLPAVAVERRAAERRLLPTAPAISRYLRLAGVSQQTRRTPLLYYYYCFK